MEIKENLVKKTCKTLGINQKELAKITSISIPTINRWSSTSKMPEQNIFLLNLMVENFQLKNEIDKMKEFLETFEKYSNIKLNV